MNTSRIVGHYATLDVRDEERRRPLESYAAELAAFGDTTTLVELAETVSLDAVDRAHVVALLGEALPAKPEQALHDRFVMLASKWASNKTAVEAAVRGIPVPSIAQMPGFPTDLSGDEPGFGRNRIWRKRLDDVFWRAVLLLLNGQPKTLTAYKDVLAKDTRERARAILATVFMAEECAATVTSGILGVDGFCRIKHDLRWPTFWPRDEGPFRDLFDSRWIDYISYTIHLASMTSHQCSLTDDMFQKLWKASGKPFGILDLLEVAHACRCCTTATAAACLRWSLVTVTGWEDYFPQRAEMLARIASVAAAANQDAVASDAIALAAENLIAYGWRKDTTLHHAIEMIRTIHRHSIGDAQQLLCDIAPLVRATEDMTDGDETRHLPILMFESLTTICPRRMSAYLIELAESEEWYDLDVCTKSYVHSLIADTHARAVGRTLTNDAAIVEFAAHWGSWIATECAAHERAEEQAIFDRWHAVTEGVLPDLEKPTPSPISERTDPTAPDTPTALLEQIKNRRLPRLFGIDSLLTSRVEAWFPVGVDGVQLDLLRQLCDAWLDFDAAYDATLTDALWRACLRNRERSRAFDLLVLAQAQDRGWAPYWSAPERSLERQQAVLDHFGERAMVFIARSLRSKSTGYGIGDPSVVCEFLCKSGRIELAWHLARGRVDDIKAMFPSYPLPLVKWTTEQMTARTSLDVLYSRLDHPEAFVRVRAAEELARLPDKDTTARLLDQIRVATPKGRPVASWLALLLRLNDRKHLDTHAEAALRELEQSEMPVTRYLAREALRCVGKVLSESNDTTSHVRAGVSVDETIPGWFLDLVESGPYRRRLDDYNGRIRTELLVEWYRAAGAMGVESNGVYSLSRAERHLRDHQNTYRPHDTRLADYMIASFASALHAVAINEGASEDAALRLVSDEIPFDPGYCVVGVQGRPPWCPPPQRLDPYKHEVVTSPLVDWRSVLDMSMKQRLFACDLTIRHATTAEATTVLPFMYSVEGIAMPLARDVFDYLNEFACMDRRRGIWEFTPHVAALTARVLDTPAALGDLDVFAVCAHYRSRIRRWHALQGYFCSFRLLPSTPVSRGLELEWRPTLAYAEGSEDRLHGYFWQSEGPRFIHRDLHFSGGFVLEADGEWMKRLEAETGLRWAWARRTKVLATGRHGEEAPANESYQLHGVSMIIAP